MRRRGAGEGKRRSQREDRGKERKRGRVHTEETQAVRKHNLYNTEPRRYYSQTGFRRRGRLFGTTQYTRGSTLRIRTVLILLINVLHVLPLSSSLE